MDKALLLHHENLTRVPTDTDKQLEHLKELENEKFLGIDKQFKERDTRVEQSTLDTRVRVDAAFAAAKELAAETGKSNALSIAKSEEGMLKQLNQLGVLIEKAMESPRIEIASVKERLTLIEGKSFGQVATQLGHQTSASFIVALVVAAVVVIGFIMDKIK